MFGDNDNDQLMRESWGDFCDKLKEAGELVFRDGSPSDDIDRAKGFRFLARNVSLALQFKFENNDPQFPELQPYFTPTRKQGGDNTDALYVGSPVDGENTYKIWGQRGTASFFVVTVLEDGDTPWGGAVIGQLLGDNMLVNEDGTFEIIIGPTPHAGNWICTRPGAWRVTIRQFFSDWENEQPMRAQIDRLGAPLISKEPKPESMAKGLKESAQWLQESTRYWADMLGKWQNEPNRFYSYRQLDKNAIDATPGGEPLICYWKIPYNEALCIRVKPPEARYWAVEFGNCWWESMDYRYRLCSTNSHHAVLEDNGELIIIVSHDDPGVPNWLDPSGHQEGYVTFRWIGSEHYPLPVCTQFSRSALDTVLPVGHKTITSEQRRQQLVGRRQGVNKRFY